MEAIEKRDILKLSLITIPISLWLYWLWTRRDLYIFSFKFPGNFGKPLLGSLLEFKHVKYALTVLGEMFADCKTSTICIWMGLFPGIFTVNPEYIEKVLQSPELLNKSKALYAPVHQFFKGGIIVLPVKEWNHHRKLLMPSFQHKVLLNFLPIFNKAKKLTITKLETVADNQEHKISNILRGILMDVSVETTMGIVMNESEQNVTDLTDKFTYVLENLVTQITFNFLHLNLVYNYYTQFKKAKIYLHNFVSELIQKKISSSNGNIETLSDDDSIKKKPNIFIDQAIQIYKNNKFSYEDIIAEANTMVFAAYDTTTNGIFSTLVMLALHPDIQERVFEEICNVFPSKDFQMDYEHMEQLPYLDMVIRETLRLAPSVPIIGRQVDEKIELGKDLILPKGMQIVISIYHLHRRTDIWGPNAAKFNPDNFLPENLTDKHSYAYIPFSKGARNCIGWRYALFAIKVMLAGLIRNYRFETTFKFEDLHFFENISLKYRVEPTFKLSPRI